MEYKRAENERASIGREHEDEYVHKILIAAATTLAMACLKRILVMFFMEQWRARVFLILNLVLLAIFVTSIRSSSSSSENQEIDDAKIIKNQEKKGRKECGGMSTLEKESKKCHNKTRDAHEVLGQEEGHHKVDSEAHNLSKEELNERVEAFIAMFRQHLVSDARKGKNQFLSSPKQTQIFNLHKGSKFTNSNVAHRHSFCI